MLTELVSVQSDTGTALERDMAAKVLELIHESPYFRERPEQCGAFEKGDILGRPVVWALRRGGGNRTVILEGHYDAVEIDTYGALKSCALSPSLLRERMLELGVGNESLKRDLADADWAFGRGTADMKAGLAINLDLVLNHRGDGANILFLAVPDEENLSSGALQAVHLLKDLQKRFDLDYALAIITEPQVRPSPKTDPIQLLEGSMGKILPVVLAKGVLAHSAEVLNGLNASFILSEIVHAVELSTDFVSEDKGIYTQPPTALYMRDQKSRYDVSIPEYGAACLNVLFLKSKSPADILDRLKAACAKALDAAIRRYDEAFGSMAKRGFADEADRKRFHPETMTLSGLEDRLSAADSGFEAFKKDLQARLGDRAASGQIDLQTASIQYMRAVVERSRIPGPAVVIGLAPPYYPAVNNAATGKDIEPYLAGLSEYMEARHGIPAVRVPYFSGMTDMSYLSSQDPQAERAVLRNLTLARESYDVPVEKICELNIPALMIGPAGRDIHQAGERVYMPDVALRIPDLIARIIERV